MYTSLHFPAWLCHWSLLFVAKLDKFIMELQHKDAKTSVYLYKICILAYPEENKKKEF